MRKLELRFAVADLVFDDLRQDFFGVALADRALQVGELEHRHLGTWLAEDQPVLRNAGEFLLDLGDIVEVAASPPPSLPWFWLTTISTTTTATAMKATALAILIRF